MAGDRQHGIDIRVVTADGERIGIQCKRYQKFQPSSFTKAVSALDRVRADVDRCILFLSVHATGAVLEACAELDGWSIWDSRTLSREVHALPPSQALSLVDQYFPGAREEFLGVRTPSVWLTAEESFPGVQNRYGYVGRSDILESLLEFAADGAGNRTATTRGEPRVAVVTAAAGLGKSRLLRELSSRHALQAGGVTRILLPGPVAPEMFEQLPESGPLLVLVDDAHERLEDLPRVVSAIFRARPQAAVVLAARPYGRPTVRSALQACGAQERTVPSWELPALSSSEAQQLAAEILGPGQEGGARFLAQVAADSPLLLVSAATAAREGRLALAELAVDADVRRQLLDTLTGSALIGSPQPDEDRALLHAFAAMQPVIPDVPNFQDSLEGLLQVPFPRIGPQMQRLEEAGVLVRRGAGLRISPDLLGDALLAEAAVDHRSGSPTGYLRRVREQAKGDALVNAIINAGRVDWQWNSGRPFPRSMIDPLWSVLEAEFKDGDADARVRLLDLVRRIAPFQPQRTVSLVRWGLDNPLEQHERPSGSQQPGSHGQAAVLRRIPRVLEAVTADVDLLRTVYDMLWELGRDDTRPLHNRPDSPLRILQDLASYEPWKPLAYQEILLDALQEWLTDSPPRPEDRMPLALLDPLYSDSAESRTLEGMTLTIGRHRVVAETVADVRERATALLLDQYTSPDEVRVIAAAATVEHALRCPALEFQPYSISLLKTLAERTRQSPPGPLAGLALRRSLAWSIDHGPAAVQAAAGEVLDYLPNTFEYQLAALLHTSEFDVRLVPGMHEYETARELRTIALSEAAAELARRPTAEAGRLLISLVERGYQGLVDPAVGAAVLIGEAIRLSPALAALLTDLLRQSNGAAAPLMLRSALQAWMDQSAAEAMGACRQILAEGRPGYATVVLQALQGCIQNRLVQDAGALDLARDLIESPDPTVRAAIVELALALLPSQRMEGLNLLTSVRFGDAEMRLNRLWWALADGGVLDWESLSTDQRDFFLRELTALSQLDDYPLQQFLARLAPKDGTAVVDLLKARIEHWQAMPAEDGLRSCIYQPLPYRWHLPLVIGSPDQRIDRLRSLQSWLAQPSEQPWRREMIAPDLFWLVAGGADDAVVNLLLEPYRSGDLALAAATSALLRKFPADAVWTRPDFIAEMIRQATRLSPELSERVRGNLHSAVCSGFRSFGMGQASPEDIAIRDRAAKVRTTLPRGSAVDSFYKALQDSALRTIAWQVALPGTD